MLVSSEVFTPPALYNFFYLNRVFLHFKFSHFPIAPNIGNCTFHCYLEATVHTGRFVDFKLFKSWQMVIQYIALALSPPGRTKAAGVKLCVAVICTVLTEALVCRHEKCANFYHWTGQKDEQHSEDVVTGKEHTAYNRKLKFFCPKQTKNLESILCGMGNSIL
jgi:hypothetical protein